MDNLTGHPHSKYAHIYGTLQACIPWAVLAMVLLACSRANGQRPVDKAWSVLKSGLADNSADKKGCRGWRAGSIRKQHRGSQTRARSTWGREV